MVGPGETKCFGLVMFIPSIFWACIPASGTEETLKAKLGMADGRERKGFLEPPVCSGVVQEKFLFFHRRSSFFSWYIRVYFPLNLNSKQAVWNGCLFKQPCPM